LSPASIPASAVRQAAACLTREACHHDLARRLSHDGAVRLPVLRADQARAILTTSRLPRAGPAAVLIIKRWKTNMNDLIFVLVTLAFFTTSAAFIVALGNI
jgi:hypothetical protein